jgi:hypothetical protein
LGNRIFEKNEVGDYDILFKRFTRIKIVNKRGFDAGEFVLRLNTLVPDRSILIKLPEEGLVSLEGTTYNRENGVIHEVKLDRTSIISQPEGKNWVKIKFAMPGLKEGSIFEVAYVSRCSSIIRNLDWTCGTLGI